MKVLERFICKLQASCRPFLHVARRCSCPFNHPQRPANVLSGTISYACLMVSCVLKGSVDRVSVDTMGRCGDRQSADISTDTRPMCRPRLGRHIDLHQPISMSAETRSILHRHSVATWPILYQHSDNTTLICSILTIFSPLQRAAAGYHEQARKRDLFPASGNISASIPTLASKTDSDKYFFIYWLLL